MIAQTLVLGWGIGLAAPAAWANEGACFGGAPEVVARNQPMAGELRVQGRNLFWTSGGRIRSLDLDGGKVATVGAGETIRALDDDVLVSASPRNQLWLLDRHSGKARVLVDGRRHLEDALVQSSVGVHGGYVYFGRTAPDYRTQEAAGFFRVPIAGSRPAERLAMEPDGQTPFVVARGDVVWVSVEPNGIVIHRRPLGVRGDASRAERRPIAGRSSAAPATSANWAATVDLLKLVDDQLFFTAGDAIWSVPLDRREPARERVRTGTTPASTQGDVVDLVAHGACAYFVVDDTIRRARMDGGAASELVVAADRLGEASLATDGRFLYWASRDGNILRSGPSAAAHVVRPPLVARPTPVQPNRPLDRYQVVLGDDFGCTLVVRDWSPGGAKWRCWRAGPGTPPRAGAGGSGLARVESFAMPGLEGLRFTIGGGRVCTQGGGGVRCAPASEVLATGGQVLRPPDARTGAGGSSGTISATDHDLLVGETFACTMGAKGWRCTGDDSYGQRASDAMADPARSAAGAWRATGGALGAAHGCVTVEGGRTACWGRNDVGQLGHPSADVCRVGDAAVPCSRSPRETAAPQHDRLIAGDQFTCAIGQGQWCWGGSRDGVFGTPNGCAPSLRQAWPTRAGPVAAPRATCARAPVQVAGFSDADAGRPSQAWVRMTQRRDWKYGRGPAFRFFSAGPRGICGIARGRVRCRGAVPTPVVPAGGPELFHEVLVNPGDRPSACANNRGNVICWGAGYSPASEQGRPVEVDFDEGASGGASVVDAPPPAAGGWPKECLVHRACLAAPPPLPICAGRADVPAWADLRPRAAALAGTRISVRGPLAVARHRDRPCGSPCCRENASGAIVVGVTDLDADGVLVLAGDGCRGDDSRLCCPLPAYGQLVRVEGTLVRSGARHYQLQSPQICQEPAAP